MEAYAVTGILGSKRLETELVNFYYLEFVKAKPELSCKQQCAGKLFFF